MWTLQIFLSVLVTSVLLQSGICAEPNNDLKSEIKAMVAEMLEEYQSTIRHLQSEVAQLNSVVIHQNAKIQELDNKIVKLAAEQSKTVAKPFLDVQKGNGASETIGKTGGKMGNVLYPKLVSHGKQKNVGFLKRSVDKLNGDTFTSRELAENVAFCSYLDHDLTHMAIGRTMKYNQVILNDGGAYNTHTGVFTVPITGVYLFMFHYDSAYGKTEIRLVVDDVNVVGSVVGPANFDLMGGNSAIIHATRGQAVWTETYVVNDQEVTSRGNYRKTTFAGVLLYTKP